MKQYQQPWAKDAFHLVENTVIRNLPVKKTHFILDVFRNQTRTNFQDMVMKLFRSNSYTWIIFDTLTHTYTHLHSLRSFNEWYSVNLNLGLNILCFCF